MTTAAPHAETLRDGATVAIVGGGPAGSFLAIQMLRLARACKRQLRVVIFEHRRPPTSVRSCSRFGPYKGCPLCAGGVSPRLSDALERLDIEIPDRVVQSQIHSIAVQGHWKPVYLNVPNDRKMLSVYRGDLPHGHGMKHESFDAFLADTAIARGADLVGSRVLRAGYDQQRFPVLTYVSPNGERSLRADFVAFAGGMNETTDQRKGVCSSTDLFRMLQPAYQPPKLRRALIAELAAPHDCAELNERRLHYFESTVENLHLDMCSIMPKQGYFTISLIGQSVDRATSNSENLALVRRFLATPQIRQILPAGESTRIRCLCNPSIVIGTAKMPFAHRTAVLGDMATCRQYKDGILAAHDLARDLANVTLGRGVDLSSLATGYGPTLTRFERDNRFASVIFFLYRWFFAHTSLSRVLYQTFASERKSQNLPHRSFERIFWAISSGDENYEQIAWAMLRPSTLWNILTGGIGITLRNWCTELFFGLNWAGIGRFPTAVALETQRCRRNQLLLGQTHEFECMYSIRIRAGPEEVRRLLGALGEPARPYLHPRWVNIRRVRGEPLKAGCTIRYRIFGGGLEFDIVQEESNDEDLIRYRVVESFADGGSFIFLIEPESDALCCLTVYLAFDYARGTTDLRRFLWRAFRFLFPEYIHDVLWNHALCEFKGAAEARWTPPGCDRSRH